MRTSLRSSTIVPILVFDGKPRRLRVLDSSSTDRAGLVMKSVFAARNALEEMGHVG